MSTSSRVPTTDKPTLAMERGEPSYADQLALAATLLKTGFLPAAIKTPGQALAIILTGREMKLGPMQSLRSISVINGRPVVAADLQLALFKRDGGQAKWLVNTATEAKLWVKHPNGDEHTQSFTMEDAIRAKLPERGDTYAKYPQAMLRARAITSSLKAIGYEPVTGVYDPDEMATITPTDGKELLAVVEQLPTEARLDTDDGSGGDRPATGRIAPPAAPPAGPAKAGRKADFTPTTFRGTPLDKLTTDELVKLRGWASAKDPEKFREQLEAIEEILAGRGGD